MNYKRKVKKESNKLDFIDCACKVSASKKDSKRQEIKELIERMEKYNKNVAYNIFKSTENVNIDTVLAIKKDGEKQMFLDNY